VKIIIEQDKCVASGQRVPAADDVFDQRDDDGIVAQLNDGPSPERPADVRQAALVCPALAITVEA
jgi:ferredoxin